MSPSWSSLRSHRAIDTLVSLAVADYALAVVLTTSTTDNSPFYANEANVGEAIRQSGIAREDLYLTTKFDHIGNESVEAELAKSLEKVRLASAEVGLQLPDFCSPSTARHVIRRPPPHSLALLCCT